MRYSIQKDHHKPIYIRLYELLREDIIAGVYPYGSKLPSKRTVKEELGISLISVEHALELLTDEGYIESRERSGYFVRYRKSDVPFSPSQSAHLVKKMEGAGASDDYFPFSVLAKAMRRVLSVYGEDLYVRCPNKGSAELREALARFLLRSKNISVTPDRIFIGAGAEWLYMTIAMTFGKGSVIAVEDPSYEKIGQIYASNDSKTLKLPLGRDGVLSEALWACKADLLHVTPYRSFPTGVTTSGAKRRAYIEWAQKNGAYILEDDYLSEFSVSKKPEETIFSIDGGVRVIYVNSFAQTICPTIRVGYAVLPQSLVDRYEAAAGFYTCPVPAFEQYVLAELIESGDFERHLNRVRRKRRKEEGKT
ncbi:MAG: PLP-dependent aminotransferase family protein [Clostridia bacterium]|nr:PLP-dependent aminotransferase family protein [Clostridia bacterium]